MMKLGLGVVLLSTLAACGGGGGSASPPGGAEGSLAFLVDTAAGTDDYLRARVLAVALEDGAGEVTANLLPEPADLTWADPTGTPSGLNLRVPPESAYTSIRVLLAPGSVRARRQDGTVDLLSGSRADLRIPFTAPWSPADGRSWVVRHRSAVDLSSASWTPDLTVGSGSSVSLSEIPAVVAHVDVARGELIATLPTVQERAVDVVLESDAFLVGEDGGRRSRAQWLAELAAGSVLAGRGILDDGSDLRCHYCSHRRGDDSDDESEGKLVGRIVRIDAASSMFTMSVQAFVRRGDPLPPPRAEVEVDSSRAVIYRSDFRHEPLAFDALAVGQLVEVEGAGIASDSPFVAREVEIEDHHGGGDDGARGESEGRVDSVLLDERRIVVVPRGDDPLMVGGQSVPSADVLVDDATAIYRRTDDGLVTIALDSVRPGERIDFRGLVLDPRTVRATWVRVRED